MRICTTDPISMQDVTDLDNSPYVIEGNGESALKIYFENDENRLAYLDIEMEQTGGSFESMLDNPT